jgi:hypothetical protein
VPEVIIFMLDFGLKVIFFAMSGINLPSLLEHWENSKMLTEYIIANPQYYDELMQYAFDDGQPGAGGLPGLPIKYMIGIRI